MKLRLNQNNITDLLKLEKVTEKQSYIQELGIKYFIESNGQLICSWATATGKTILAVKIINKLLLKNPNLEIDVVVPFDILKHQWEKHFTEFKNVNVFILKTYSHLKRSPYLLIVDECHLGVSNESSISTNNLLDYNAKYRLFLSATLKKSQIDFLKSKGLKNEFHIPLQESILLNIVPKLKIFNIGIDFTEQEKEVYSKAIFLENKCKTYFSNFNIEHIPKTEPKFENDTNPKLTKIMYYNWLRARNKRVHTIYNAQNKFTILKQLNDILKDRKVIYLSTTQKNAEIVKKEVKCDSYHSGVATKKADENLRKFYENETTKISSVMKLIAGFDDACTDTLVRVSFFSAKAGTWQSLGK